MNTAPWTVLAELRGPCKAWPGQRVRYLASHASRLFTDHPSRSFHAGCVVKAVDIWLIKIAHWARARFHLQKSMLQSMRSSLECKASASDRIQRHAGTVSPVCEGNTSLRARAAFQPARRGSHVCQAARRQLLSAGTALLVLKELPAGASAVESKYEPMDALKGKDYGKPRMT